MIIGFHSVALRRTPILAAIDKVAAAGYGAIELNAEALPWAEPHVTPGTSTAERQAIMRRAREAGLAISAVSAHVPMVDADAALREQAVRFVKGCVDLAHDTGVPVAHILSGERPTDVDAGTAWSWFADAVAACVQRAQQQGVILAIEAIAGHLFHEVADFDRLATSLPNVPFRCNFDPSHLVVQGEPPERMIERQALGIVHVHAKDGSGRMPGFNFPPLGEGEIDFLDLLRRLRRSGYDGVISVEYEANIFGFGDDEDTVLRRSHAFMTRVAGSSGEHST